MIAYLALLLIQPRIDLGIVYSKVGGSELKMDVYYPTVPQTGAAGGRLGPTPAVLVMHGGAWIQGARQDMAALCRMLAAEGVLAATIDYRLAPKFRWPAMLDDAQTAARYLRTNAAQFNIDTNRIGAAGASAGGHMALFLGFCDTRDPKPAEYPKASSRVNAVLDLFGPTDLSVDYPPSMDMIYGLVLGKKRQDAAAEIKAGSPINYLDKDDAPVFIVQGTADKVVPPKQSERLDGALERLGIRHEAVFVEGMTHDLNSKDPAINAKINDAVVRGVRWLKTELLKRPTAIRTR